MGRFESTKGPKVVYCNPDWSRTKIMPGRASSKSEGLGRHGWTAWRAVEARWKTVGDGLSLQRGHEGFLLLPVDLDQNGPQVSLENRGVLFSDRWPFQNGV